MPNPETIAVIDDLKLLDRGMKILTTIREDHRTTTEGMIDGGLIIRDNSNTSPEPKMNPNKN